MLIHPWDAAEDAESWAFVEEQGFGHLVASGRGREVPVVVPTQFVVANEEQTTNRQVLLHLARANPIWAAIQENESVVLSVAEDWVYVPAAWKAIDNEDPSKGGNYSAGSSRLSGVAS